MAKIVIGPVWITKYALTKGIIRKEQALLCPYHKRGSSEATMIEVEAHEYYHSRDWHRTEAEAVARANKMREKKIASLKAKLEHLRELSFSESR